MGGLKVDFAAEPAPDKRCGNVNLGRVNIQRPCQPLTQWMRRLGRNPKFNIISGAAGRNATVGFKTAVGLGLGLKCILHDQIGFGKSLFNTAAFH